MATNMNAISVPVRLKVLQDSISEFQKILDNLQPNTKNWRELNKLINSMTTDTQKLQAQLSKPFSSQQQFNSTEKTIDKLEEAAARVAVVMSGLKFSDIKLTPEQTEELKKFESEIEQIRESYKKLQEQTKEKLLGDTKTSDLLGNLNGNVLNKSFSEIESAVDNHINVLKKKVSEKNEQYKSLLSNKQLGENATQLVTNGLTAGSIGSNLFDKFLRQTESGLQIKSWNNGVTKQALLNAIGDMYHLEPGEIQRKIEESLGKSLNNININEISKWFSEQGAKSGLFSGITRQGKNATANVPIVLQELDSLRAQVREYEAIQQEIARLRNTDITPASAQNDAQIASLTGRLQELQNSIFSSAAAMNNYKTAAASMNQANNQLRNVLQETNAQFLRQQAVLNSFNAMKTTVANFMGFYQVLNLTKRAIKEAANHIKELDSVMNKISIVTNMDTSDLWGQIDQYSKMAQTYGTTIKGAYEVSQIYYQQGLDTADVMTLTNETLKLAKVSGLDYAATTDYMTTALRGFKMEMSEAATVVDVYSNLAANTAVSQEELAVAMSKTASSMESVGSSFEETSAMIATMVAVTRESATNIGSALKSIAARYGEMKSDPLAMTDEDGEELVYNKVDAALQSVGITLKDTEGQFRNFTEVITELAEKWDQLESTQQRYIATQFAGNRQQSRFLALVSNKDLLAQNISVAENSEDIGTVQALKALDSLESKIEQVRVAYQQFYTTIGIEDVWKNFLDGTKTVINTLNGMPKLFGKLPIGALNAIVQVVNLLKTFAFQGLQQVANLLGKGFRTGWDAAKPEMEGAAAEAVQQMERTIEGRQSSFTSLGQKLGTALSLGLKNPSSFLTESGQKFGSTQLEINQLKDWQSRISYLQEVQKRGETVPGQLQRGYASLANELMSAGLITEQFYNKLISGSPLARRALDSLGSSIDVVNTKLYKVGTGINSFGQALNMLSLVINTTTRGGKALSGTLQMVAGVAITAGALIKSAGEIATLGWSAVPWVAVASGIIAIINGLSQAIQAASPEAKLEELTAKAEELSNKSKQLKADYKTIETATESYKKLEAARYDSAEAAEEYRTAVDKLADTYPQLIESYDANNEAVLNASAMDRILTEAREASARATLQAAEAEAKRAQGQLEIDRATLKKPETSNEISSALSWWSVKNRVYSNWDELDLTSGEGVDLELRDAVNDFYIAAREGNIDGINASYKKIDQLVTNNGIKLNTVFSDGIDKVLNAANVVESDMNVIKAAKTTTVASYLDSRYVSQGNDLLSGKNSQGFLNFANREIEKRMQGETDFTSWTIAPYAQDVVDSLDLSFGNLTNSQIEQLDDIFSSADKYTRSDLAKLADEFDITIDEWMYDLFDDKTQDNIEFLQGKTNKLKTQGIDVEDIDSFLTTTTEMSLNERQLMQLGLNQAQALKKNGQDPTDFLSNFIEFYTYASQLPAQLRNSLIDEFQSNGFTYEGLQQTQNWIDENIIDSEKTFDLSELKNTYIPNFSLSLQTMESTLEEDLGDLESLFSDLSGGIKASKLDDAIAQAQKLGVTLTKNDFEANGEKLVLKYANFGELISGIQRKYEAKTDDLINMYKRAVGTDFDDNDEGYDYLTSDTAAIRSILGEEKYAEFYENDQLREGIEEDEVISAIHESYTVLYDEYKAYNEWVTFLSNQFTKNIDWQHGDYSSLDSIVAKSWKVGNTEVAGTTLDRIRYLAAHPGEMTEDERDSVDLRNAIDTYQSGIKSLLSDITTKPADEIIANANNYKGLSEDFVTDIAEKIQKGELTTYQAIQLYAQEAGNTIAETNELIVEALEKNTLRGSVKTASELAKGTFTLSDLNSYVTKYGVKKEGSDERDYSIDQFLDNGQLSGPLANVYQWDEASASYKATGTLDSVITAWETALKITLTENSELYQDLIQGWTSDAIREADKADWGKQMASGISSLSSAKVGTRIDLSKSPELQAQLEELGYNVTDGYYEVVSEYARDSMILALTSTDAEVNATLKPLQEAIKTKRSRSNARLGISGTSFDQADLDKYIDTFTDASEYSASTKQWYAEEFLGYKWDEDLQRYIATEDAITELDEEIANAVNENKSEDYIKELRGKRGELAAYFRKDEKRDVLSNLLSNYEDVADYIDDFYTQFGIDLEAEGLIVEKDGKRSVNVDLLKEKFPDIAETYKDLFDDFINTLADEYINNASKAGSLVTQGTTSKTEMDAFQEAYEQVMGDGQIANFIYDSITHTMVLDPMQLRGYLQGVAARKEFGLTPEQQRDWVDSQLETLTVDNLNFSDYISGTASEKDTNELRRNLENYAKTHLPKEYELWPIEDQEEYIKGYADRTLSAISQGGQAAIDAVKSTGKELSTDEIEALYRAQVAPLTELADTLSTLETGSVVAKNQIAALTKAGFTVSAEGVITSTGDLVDAYRSIYIDMKNTNEATISELNKVVGNILDNRDNQQGAIDALSNATNMTYSQFVEIFSNAGIEITETMMNNLLANGTIKALGGNKMMISDFDQLAAAMQAMGKWEIGSEEYINALSNYRDGMISYWNQLGDAIKGNFDAISNAKVGDQINLTQLLSAFPEYEAELEETFGDIIQNGILTVRNALTLPQLAVAIGNKAIEEGGMLAEELEAFVASVHDNILSGITTAFDYGINGTNSIASMQAFAQEYNTLTGENKNYSQLFGYDTILNTFTLNQNVLNNYISAQKAQLETLGLSGEAIDEYIKDQTDTILRENIELENFLNAETSDQRNEEANKLINYIKNLSNYLNIANLALARTYSDEFLESLSLDEIRELRDTAILKVLESGGKNAIELLKEIKPNATQEELENAFNSQINKLNDAFSQVESLVAGQFVGTEGKLYQILNFAGAVDDDGVVKAGFDMADVYTRIYAEMKNTEGHTTQGLNQVYAKLLTARAQSNINLKDALSNAGGMSPDNFANLMDSYGLNMEEVLHDNITNIIVDQFGNILIKDFQAFSSYMNEKADAGWDPNDPALKELYSSYTDAKVDLMNQTINDTKTASEQLSSVLEAKAGQAVNVSYLGLDELFDNNEAALNAYLLNFGAAYEDGILKIGNEAAIPSLVRDIGQRAAKAGIIIPEQLAELEDAITAMLDDIVSLLSNGISGSLSNTELLTVTKWYNSLAQQFPDLAQSLDITHTAEGLQFTESSLANIYALLKRINAQKAEGFLDEIIDSKESFQTLTGALREFNDAMRLDGVSEGTNKLKGLNGTLSNTAKMMQDVVQKAMTNPDSMNFMSNNLPDDMQTAVNAWENASDAITTLTTAQKNGYMGVQDFYNIVNTASSLMEAAGKNFEVAGMNAATLLQQGAANVKVVNGELTVDLSSTGLNIIGSVDQLKQNLTTGINELADAEIAIIDAEIQVLEILAAMESLSDMDVDVNNNGINFEVEDMFEFDKNGNLKGYTSQMNDYIIELQKAIEADENLEKTFKQFKINQTSLYDLIYGTAEDWVKTFGSAENASKFWQNFSAGIEGWDLEGNLQEQVLNFFKGLDSELNIDLGENGLFHIGVNGSIYSIDFSNEQLMSDAAKVAKQLKIDTNNDLPEKIREIFNADPEQITIEENLLLKVASGVVTVEYDKKGNITGYKVKGKTYTDANMAAAVGDLVQAGVTKDLPKADDVLIEGESISGKMTVGSVEIEVTSSGKGATYSNKEVNNGKQYNDIDDLYDAWFEQDPENAGKTADRASVDYKAWKVKKGITVETVFEINGRQGDINKNASLREAVNDYIGGEAAQNIEVGDQATTVTLKEGITITIPNGELEFEGEGDNKKLVEESIKSYLGDLSGLDLGLKDTIIAAIKEAFTSLKTEIEELDSEPLTEIANAISTIVTAIEDLSKNKGIEKLNEELGKLDSETLNKIGTEFNTISTNLQTLATSGNWILLTLALTLVNSLLTSIDEHTGVFDTIATSINTFPIEALNTLKTVLQDMAVALEKIDAKKQIQIDIKADGLDAILSKLQQIAQLLGQLTGQDFGLGGEGEEGDSGEEEGNVSTPTETPSGETTGGIVDAKTTDISGSEVTGEATGGIVNAETADMNGASVEGEATGGVVKPEQVDLSEASDETVTVDYEGEKTGDHVEEGAIEKPTTYDGEKTGAHVEEGAIEKPTTYNGTLTGSHVSAGSITVNVNYVGTKSGYSPGVEATGNVGKAKAQGTFEGQAYAGGTPTLMGELGPELVVQNGRYFVAGQNGAEMVSLSKDAIVFNHLQTESLLTKGMSKERGRAVTNERNAVSFATGNVNGGLAMASASAALAQLKALRAMWESLKNASVQDLAGAGGGGGGGGGGSDDSTNPVDARTWVDTVERWFNLMQDIAELEAEITHQEKIRTKISSDWQKNGTAYYNSQKKSLDALNAQIKAQEELNISRQDYFNTRVEALKNEPLGKLYEWDAETGKMNFTDQKINGKDGAMLFLTDLVGFDNNKGANYTNKEKYDILMANGFGNYMKYDSNGQEIKPDSDNDGETTDEEWEDFYENATQAFWDNVNEFKDATESLHDSILEGRDSIEELEADRNELLKEMRDNQMEVEEKVLNAIEESRQREIDALQDQRDALEESVGQYIDGLTEALDKEQQMYETQEAQDELNRNRRRLAILQRSGGSVSDINSLQAEIQEQERTMYFDAQQAQIDAIQEASDKELERLDNQIDIMTQQLEYQKEFGLLWNDVYQIMDWSAEAITAFIQGNTAEYWSSSPLATAEKVNDTLFQAEAWKAYASDMAVVAEESREQRKQRDYETFNQDMITQYGQDYDKKGKYKAAFMEEYEKGNSLSDATKVAQSLYLKDKKIADKQAAAAKYGIPYIGTGQYLYKSIDDNQHYVHKYVKNDEGQWTYDSTTKENHSWSGDKCSKCGHQKPAPPPASSGGGGGGSSQNSGICEQCASTCFKSCAKAATYGGGANGNLIRNGNVNAGRDQGTTTCNTNCIGGCKGTCGGKTNKKARGGYVGHGIYELGEQGTETVLTAQQTQILRNNILSNRPNSLISLLKTYNEGFSRMESPITGTTTEDNSVNIDKIELSMNVQQLSNDYDARKAGQEMMNEVMRIARKTSAANSIRR